MNTPSPLQGYKQQLRELKAEMKRRGIRKMSCFNGGHTPESLRFNTELFRLNTQILKHSKPGPETL